MEYLVEPIVENLPEESIITDHQPDPCPNDACFTWDNPICPTRDAVCPQ